MLPGYDDSSPGISTHILTTLHNGQMNTIAIITKQ